MKIVESTENPHFKMFCDVIEQDGFNINTFIDKLEMNLTYHFVLIHHQNKNIINYEKNLVKNIKNFVSFLKRERNKYGN